MIVLEYAFFLPILPSALPTLPAPKEMHIFVPRKKVNVKVASNSPGPHGL